MSDMILKGDHSRIIPEGLGLIGSVVQRIFAFVVFFAYFHKKNNKTLTKPVEYVVLLIEM